MHGINVQSSCEKDLDTFEDGTGRNGEVGKGCSFYQGKDCWAVSKSRGLSYNQVRAEIFISSTSFLFVGLTRSYGQPFTFFTQFFSCLSSRASVRSYLLFFLNLLASISVNRVNSCVATAKSTTSKL